MIEFNHFIRKQLVFLLFVKKIPVTEVLRSYILATDALALVLN